MTVTAIPLDNALRHANTLIEDLVDNGPSPSAEVCERLGWSKGRFTSALKAARDEVCPQLGVTIPHPIPEEDWAYQVTTEWQPIEAGAAHSLGSIEARLLGIHRDIKTVKPNLDPRTRAGRRANFLDKHLAHILGTLMEINNG